MPGPDDKAVPNVASVDYLVDEKASVVRVPPGSELEPSHNPEATVGATGPTNWWLYGVIGLAIVIALLLVMQIFSGAPGTDVQPGTPTSEPVVETPVQ
ncbi:hypothetical protein SAMN05216456_2544 [Devosia crocina]|uniref:Uncharacterized protein n=1 Tax=Devosia crocina TaxID=429728 RepID=A0A1I7NPF3_9HYPH|nr:hypothetical protein [Devosia crocina]SFV36557.1 hypothetical protein SAMN05216456_2544 [Devosia crocina]